MHRPCNQHRPRAGLGSLSWTRDSAPVCPADPLTGPDAPPCAPQTPSPALMQAGQRHPNTLPPGGELFGEGGEYRRTRGVRIPVPSAKRLPVTGTRCVS